MPRRRHALIVKDDRAALTPGSLWWAYCRVSPGERQSVASQRSELERFAAEHGLTIERWWIDDGVSGSSIEGREAFDAMIEASRVKPPAVAGVLVWNLARWARNDLDSQYYRSDLRRRGYAVVSVNDNIPSGDIAPMVEAFLDLSNRKFLETLSADTRRGLREVVTREVTVNGKKRKGMSGGGFPPRGYRSVSVQTGTRKDGKPRVNSYWELDPVWQERVTHARQMFAAGEAVAKIHAECDLFRGLAGYRTFWPNSTYAGIRRCGEVAVPDAHPAYDDPAQRAAILARVAATAQPQRQRPRTKIVHMLSGLAYCGYCGHVLHGRAQQHGDLYHCSRSQRGDSPCKARRILAVTLDGAVIELLRACILTRAELRRIIDLVNAERTAGGGGFARERQKVEAERGRLTRQIERLVDAVATSDEPPQALVARINALEGEQRAMQARLRALAAEESAAQPLLMTDEKLGCVVDELQQQLAGGDRDTVWRVVRSYVQRVTVWDERVEVQPAAPMQGHVYRFTQYPQPGAHQNGRHGLELRRHCGRPAGPRPLTERQQLVLALRAQYTLREIGEQLGVTAQAIWDSEQRARRQT